MSVFKGANCVYMGAEDIDKLFEGNERIFIVCDPFMADSGMSKYLTDPLDELKKDYVLYTKVGADPSTELVAEGVNAVAEYKPDCMVALGGGAAIDECKAMKYFSQTQGLIDEKVKLVVVPTTSGTGSEVTSFAVITDTEKAIKYPLVRDEIMPDAALLDAQYTRTVPPSITAATGMDALTHAIEAIVATNATDFSDAAAEKSIKLIRSYLKKCYLHPDDMEARQKMHDAATLAGVAFTNAGLGLVHAMAHAIGAHFHTPHGRCCAVMLPYVISFNAGLYDGVETEACKNYARIARLIKVDASTVRQSAYMLVRTIVHFNDELGVANKIVDLGVSKEEFAAALDDMVDAASKDATLATNPREVTKEQIRDLYLRAYYGTANKTIL